MSSIKSKYEDELELVEHIFEYNQNKEAFVEQVKNFNPNALRSYVVLMSYFEQRQQGMPHDLLQIFTPDYFFSKLNESKKLLDSQLMCKYLLDAFEVMVTSTNFIEDQKLYEKCHEYLRQALKNEHVNIISVYLQLFHRLDRVFRTETPVDILISVIDAVHGPITDVKLLNEALLLLESNMVKRHNLSVKTTANAQLLNFMWHNLCSSRVAKHQCNICYTIFSQLINVYLDECRLNETFRAGFLTSELWHFIRAAIESKETIRRKQAIFILQNILETNEREIMTTDEHVIDTGVGLSNIWKNYFTVLESLLEIQCQLILSCLDQYLDGIVKFLPPFWYSIIFALVLKHHNNIVIHYGIEFILQHGISLQHDSHLMNGFYQALNNTYLHAEEKISEQNLAKYFKDSDMNHTLDIMMLIGWQPVPLWTVIKSIDVYVQLTKGVGFQIELLLDFLKRSVRVIKNMPEVDDMAVRIMQNVGINKLPLHQVLGLYDVIQRTEILDGYEQPLDLQKFEMNFIQLEKISIETKINYFQHAIPNVKEQSKILDEFYEKNRTMICYFQHYEYLLFNNLCNEKPIKDALFVIKTRIYNLMKPHGQITLDSISLAASLLKFVIDKFANDGKDTSIFDSINKMIMNFYDVLRKKLYIDHNSIKQQKIYEQLTTVNMKMTKCSTLYPNKLAVLGVLADAMVLDGEDIDLVN